MTKLYTDTSNNWLITDASSNWLLTDSEIVYVAPPGYPVTPAWRDATITSFSPTLVSVTNSLRRQARSRGAHAWGVELRYPAMTRASFAPLWAFLVEQAGQSSTFLLSLPAYTPLGSAGGTPLVKGGSQVGSAVTTDGWTPTTTPLKAGDWIQFDGDLKVYMVTDDATADGSGNATVNIFPALRITPADNAAISTSPYFTCALVSDLLSVDFDQCVKARGFSVELVEVL